MENNELIKSLYGSINLTGGYCKKCEGTSIIIDEKFLCCNSFIINENFKREKTKRMVTGEAKRSYLSPKEKEEILELQENKCFYCECDLNNSWYISNRTKNPKPIKIHFDHIIPWTYSRETIKHGMVATCHICNLIKSSKHFGNEIEAREYIKNKKRNKGIQII